MLQDQKKISASKKSLKNILYIEILTMRFKVWYALFYVNNKSLLSPIKFCCFYYE